VILYPAIDILNGRAVRLYKGDKNKVTDYGEPVEIARQWESCGAEYLHVVDLDGAFSGVQTNLKTVERIAAATNLPIQLGGGVRSLDAVRRALAAGATRVIIGTAAFTSPNFLREALDLFGAEKIIAGLDSKDGFAAIKGWAEKFALKAEDAAIDLFNKGVRTIVFTDIFRDGALTGVNIPLTAQIKAISGLEVIASGGLASLNEIKSLRRAGIDGLILGKAIFDKIFTIREAQKANES